MFCFIQSVRFILFIFIGVLSLSPLLALSSDVRGKILAFLLFKKKKSVWIAFVFDVLSFLFFYSVISSPPGTLRSKKLNSGWKLRLLLQHKDNWLVCVAGWPFLCGWF